MSNYRKRIDLMYTEHYVGAIPVTGIVTVKTWLCLLNWDPVSSLFSRYGRSMSRKNKLGRVFISTLSSPTSRLMFFEDFYEYNACKYWVQSYMYHCGSNWA